MAAEIVKLEAGEFTWQEIPGHGRCLVPVVRHLVTSLDVQYLRRFVNQYDQEIQIVRVFSPSNLHFYTLLQQARPGEIRALGYSCCSFELAGDLAAYINRASHSSDILFKRWCP